LLVGLVAALVLAGCGGNSGGGGGSATTPTTEPTSTEATPAAGGQGSGNEVKLVASDFKFDQTSLSFKSGDQVKIELNNTGKVEHNFTFEEANVDQDVEGGEDATVTFTAPAAGSFKFFCKYHPAKMTGTLTIT
jgi:plastocyanin